MRLCKVFRTGVNNWFIFTGIQNITDFELLRSGEVQCFYKSVISACWCALSIKRAVCADSIVITMTSTDSLILYPRATFVLRPVRIARNRYIRRSWRRHVEIFGWCQQKRIRMYRTHVRLLETSFDFALSACESHDHILFATSKRNGDDHVLVVQSISPLRLLEIRN